MAADTLKSTSITNLDATPIVPTTAGMGVAAGDFLVDDKVTVTAVGIGTVASWYRMVRFPTIAKIKGLTLATSASLDTNGAPTLVFDINVAFSDSTVDGTTVSNQGLIPTTANTGATTSIATYASPNKMFGTWTPFTASAHSSAVTSGNLAWNGIGTTYTFLGISLQPLWQTFGFTDGRGNPADPGGYFDILLYVSTGAATGVAGDVYCQLNYTV